MTRYIANETNLRLMMNLLREKSKNIQFEAFHVFKVGPRSPRTFGGCQTHFVPLSGVRREPEEASANRDYPEAEQGQASRLLEGLP